LIAPLTLTGALHAPASPFQGEAKSDAWPFSHRQAFGKTLASINFHCAGNVSSIMRAVRAATRPFNQDP
jgi:hypothetical protein